MWQGASQWCSISTTFKQTPQFHEILTKHCSVNFGPHHEISFLPMVLLIFTTLTESPTSRPEPMLPVDRLSHRLSVTPDSSHRQAAGSDGTCPRAAHHMQYHGMACCCIMQSPFRVPAAAVSSFALPGRWLWTVSAPGPHIVIPL